MSYFDYFVMKYIKPLIVDEGQPKRSAQDRKTFNGLLRSVFGSLQKDVPTD